MRHLALLRRPQRRRRHPQDLGPPEAAADANGANGGSVQVRSLRGHPVLEAVQAHLNPSPYSSIQRQRCHCCL